MKITLCGSDQFFDELEILQEKLQDMGHEVLHPYDTALAHTGDKGGQDAVDPEDMSPKARKIKEGLIQSHLKGIKVSDAILVANYDKKGINNYIGGNTFLEMGFAYAFGKKIFLLNPIPTCSYTDELSGLLPVVIFGDLAKIK